MAETEDELREKLRDVNEQIAVLGGEADAAFAQAGGDADGAQDSEDVADELVNAMENEALLQPLYERRRTLHEQLGD